MADLRRRAVHGRGRRYLCAGVAEPKAAPPRHPETKWDWCELVHWTRLAGVEFVAGGGRACAYGLTFASCFEQLPCESFFQCSTIHTAHSGLVFAGMWAGRDG